MSSTDWQVVVERHGPLVWRTVYRLVGNSADAADCFQETFVSALSVCRRQRVRNWPGLLSRLATARALDRLRQRLARAGRQADLADWTSVPSPNPGPVELAEAAELGAQLRRALVQLPAQQSEVFCLRCLNDLSYRQIARQMGIKTSNVGVLLHRARVRLRELLVGAGVGQEM